MTSKDLDARVVAAVGKAGARSFSTFSPRLTLDGLASIQGLRPSWLAKANNIGKISKPTTAASVRFDTPSFA